MTRRRAVLLALEIATPIVVIGCVWAYTATAESYYFPPLPDVVAAFQETWLFDRVASDLVPSVRRLLSGYAIAVVVGVLGGLLLGQSRIARSMTAPVIEFLRAIPPPAMIPFTILVIGVGDGAKVFLIALVCLWPILLNTIDGVTGVDPTLLETDRVYGTSRLDRQRSVVLPAASPQIFAGLRTSLALALIMMVVSEMVASTNGIGYLVLSAQREFAIPEMWAGILALGLLGYGLNALFSLIERRVLAWHRGSRAAAW